MLNRLQHDCDLLMLSRQITARFKITTTDDHVRTAIFSFFVCYGTAVFGKLHRYNEGLFLDV